MVVGGGAIGVACAYHLAEAGLDVTILERGEISGGCSYAHAGLIVPGYSHALPAPGVMREGFRHLLRRDGPFTIRPRRDPALARWLLTFRRSCAPELSRRATGSLTALSRLSLELFESLQSNGEVDFGYRRGALLNVYMSDGWQGRARAFRDELHGLGGEGRLLEQNELLELEPALSPNVRRRAADRGPGLRRLLRLRARARGQPRPSRCARLHRYADRARTGSPRPGGRRADGLRRGGSRPTGARRRERRRLLNGRARRARPCERRRRDLNTRGAV